MRTFAKRGRSHLKMDKHQAGVTFQNSIRTFIARRKAPPCTADGARPELPSPGDSLGNQRAK